MSWEWDRGTTGRDPFSADSRESDIRHLFDYAETREAEDADLDRLRSDPAILALVSKRLKKSIGRTADIPIRCGTRDEGKSMSFGIVGGKVELVMIQHAHPSNADGVTHQFRLTGEDTANVPLKFPCRCRPGGSQRAPLVKRMGIRRTRLWLYKAALAALASDTRKRPSVQLHT